MKLHQTMGAFIGGLEADEGFGGGECSDSSVEAWGDPGSGVCIYSRVEAYVRMH
jgi:hypothetical protein